MNQVSDKLDLLRRLVASLSRFALISAKVNSGTAENTEIMSAPIHLFPDRFKRFKMNFVTQRRLNINIDKINDLFKIFLIDRIVLIRLCTIDIEYTHYLIITYDRYNDLGS